MKKLSIILIGILSPLYYHLIFNLMLCMEYNERYASFQNIMLFILPALPGVVMAFALVRKSMKNYFMSLGTCFLISAAVFALYYFLNIDLIVYKTITGYDELSNGEGLLFAVTFFSYAVSCFAGALISGVVSLVNSAAICSGRRI